MQKSMSSWVGKTGSKSPTASKSRAVEAERRAAGHRAEGLERQDRQPVDLRVRALGQRSSRGSAPSRSKRAATKSWVSSAVPMAASQPGATVSSASQNGATGPRRRGSRG